MKKLIILLSIVTFTSLIADNNVTVNTNELSWVDEQVEAIKPPRSGAKNGYLNSIRNPFVFLKTGKAEKTVSNNSSAKPKVATVTKTQTAPKQKKKSLTLEAIINKTALIDGRWYQEGESVYGYKIEKIDGRNVNLNKNGKHVLLTTKSELKSLKFNN